MFSITIDIKSTKRRIIERKFFCKRINHARETSKIIFTTIIIREKKEKSNFKKEKTLLFCEENNKDIHLMCVRKTKQTIIMIYNEMLKREKVRKQQKINICDSRVRITQFAFTINLTRKYNVYFLQFTKNNKYTWRFYLLLRTHITRI